MRWIKIPMRSNAVGALIFLGLVGCGGGGDSGAPPTIDIRVPTSAASYATTSSSVRIGGAVTLAGSIRVRNTRTGSTTEAFVFYVQGNGSWFADVFGLAPGDNLITATADTGTRTATARITVTRPLQPAAEILNGPDQASANTFWSLGNHRIALFADGTGRSTTGSTTSQNAGAAVDMLWSQTGPESISINGCATCAFQTISRISGSVGDGQFLGQVVTVGGAGTNALDSFILTAGNL